MLGEEPLLGSLGEKVEDERKSIWNEEKDHKLPVAMESREQALIELMK